MMLGGAKPLVARCGLGLRLRDAICASVGHRPSHVDSNGEARCLRCLKAINDSYVGAAPRPPGSRHRR